MFSKILSFELRNEMKMAKKAAAAGQLFQSIRARARARLEGLRGQARLKSGQWRDAAELSLGSRAARPSVPRFSLFSSLSEARISKNSTLDASAKASRVMPRRGTIALASFFFA